MIKIRHGPDGLRAFDELAVPERQPGARLQADIRIFEPRVLEFQPRVVIEVIEVGIGNCRGRAGAAGYFLAHGIVILAGERNRMEFGTQPIHLGVGHYIDGCGTRISKFDYCSRVKSC